MSHTDDEAAGWTALPAPAPSLDLLWAAYRAGFAVAGEGWNGEYGGPDAGQAPDNQDGHDELRRAFEHWLEADPVTAPSPDTPEDPEGAEEEARARDRARDAGIPATRLRRVTG